MIRAIRPLETHDVSPLQEEEAGFGALRTERGCLPLTALDVRGKICGLHAHTVVRQTFHNAFAEAIEATYIFPLPDRAAVTSFTMRVAGRLIEGALRERQQAREEYDQAIAAGHRAAIAEEERSGTFSLRVGNLPPGEDISVELTLVGPLTVTRGEAEFRFPLVVAPRYVPGVPLNGPPVGLGVGHDTDQVPDASRVTPPVLLPGFPNPVRLSLELEFDAASMPTTPESLAKSLRSSLHGVIVDETAGLTVRVQPAERLDRDFILRCTLATERVVSVLSWTPAVESRPGTFALSLVPPAELADRPPQPRDVVFVLDRSGSMNGWKMVAARRAVGRLLDTLLEHDRFCVLAFDNAVEFSPETKRQLAAAGNRARWRTIEWLGGVDARGGTELAGALSEAVGLLAAGDAAREPVIVLITDGQVSGEDSLLKTLAHAAHGRPPRVFAVGIDRAVNAGFLRRLADLGRGACELVESEDRLDEVMDKLHRLTSAPALREVRLEPIGWRWQDDSLAPARLADVFVDRPVTLFGRHTAAGGNLRMRVQGTDAAGRSWQHEVCGAATTGDLLTSLWGRARVRDLEDRYASRLGAEDKKLAEQIVAVSLESHVLSRFTAYLAIDRSEVVNADGKPREILQPVELPSGWEQPEPLFCRAAPASGFVLYSSAAAPAAGAHIGGSKARLRQSGGAPLDRLKAAADSFKSPGWFSPRRTRLKALIDALVDLESQLQALRHPRLPEVSELIERGRELLAGYNRGAKQPPSASGVEEYVAKIQTLIEELRQTPGLVRAGFWK